MVLFKVSLHFGFCAELSQVVIVLLDAISEWTWSQMLIIKDPLEFLGEICCKMSHALSVLNSWKDYVHCLL